MKKRFLLIVLCCTVAAIPVSAQKIIDMDFNVNDYHIINSNSILHIEPAINGLSRTENTDEPALPYHSLRILVPQNAEDAPFSVSYEKTILYENVDMEANPAPMTTNGVKMQGNVTAITSVTEPILNKGIVRYGEFRYLYLKITPFIFYKNTRQLFFVNNIRLIFPTLSNSSSTINRNDLPLNYRSIAEKVYNTDDVLSYYPIQSPLNREYEDPVDYLVITCDSLVDSFNALTEWKNRKGLYTKVVSVESIYEGHSHPSYYEMGDYVKECIYNYYLNHGTKWVLLGGVQSIVPVRYHLVLRNNQYGIGNTPADLFYSTFSPFQWPEYPIPLPPSAMEFDIDLNPSVYVTRLPIRNSNDVLNFTNKLLSYEECLSYPEPYGRILMTGYNVPDDSVCGAKHYGDSIFSGFIHPYWDGQHYYSYPYEDVYSLPETEPIYPFVFYSNDMPSQMSLGYNVIHVVSLGTYDSLVDVYNIDDLDYNHDNFPPIIVTNACYTNNFTKPNCLSAAMLRDTGGAIAYFGSSEEGWGGVDGVIDGSFLFNGLFFRNLFTGEPSDGPYCFGAVAAKTKLDMADESTLVGVNRSLQMSINPVGDPEMQIFTSAPKSFIVNNFPYAPTTPTVLFNSRTGYIKVTSTTDSCKIVVVNGDGTIHLRDSIRIAEFYNLSGLCKVTILRHNYKPYLVDIDLDGPGPFPITGTLSLNVGQISNNLFINVFRNTGGIISETDEQDNESIGEWILSVTNAITNERKYQVTLQDSSCNISTSGWSSGIYIVSANKGSEFVTCKIIITK